MIKAKLPPENPDANLKSYYDACRAFLWADVEKEFTWSETGNVNLAYEAVDRWTRDERTRDRKALVFDCAGVVREFTYLQLREFSNQWANLFIEQGLVVGDRLFIFLPPCAETYLVMLACARCGIIFSPLYSTMSYDELEVRFQNARPKAVVTHPDLVEALSHQAMTSVRNVFLTAGPLPDAFPGEVLVEEVLPGYAKKGPVKWLKGSTPLYLVYTSGSTGPPKGVVHAHQDMLGQLMTARYVLNLSEKSVLWTDGDPGWVTGTVYGAFAPWLCGAKSVIQGDLFAASTWYRTLEKHRVTTCYTTPRTLTRLMQAGADLPARYDLSRLSHIATVGETLAPEQFYWAKKVLKHAPHDTWWMTETGMICIANYPSMSIKPGSMGRPVPGVEAAVLDENGEPVPMLTMGELALRPGWPSMMTALWDDPERYLDYFRFEGWFLTGDMAVVDEDGYYYHQGRNDDLIKVHERLVGPYEIEQMASVHPAVSEAVAISLGTLGGKLIVKVYVTINRGFTPSKRLNHEIKTFVQTNFKGELPLAEVIFMDELPKTRSGKLLRRVLRARELGFPSGDPMKLKE